MNTTSTAMQSIAHAQAAMVPVRFGRKSKMHGGTWSFPERVRDTVEVMNRDQAF